METVKQVKTVKEQCIVNTDSWQGETMKTIDAIVLFGQNVPFITTILVILALVSECGYQLAAHRKQITNFLHTARSWLLIAAGFLLVAMIFAAVLVGFWMGL